MTAPTELDRFIQRDPATHTANITFTGDHAILFDNGVQIGRSYTGEFDNVAQGDGYKLEVVQSDGSYAITKIGIGAMVAFTGQSNISRWFSYSDEVTQAPDTYQLRTNGEWSHVSGGAAREFANNLSQSLGCPVALVEFAVGGTPLLQQDDAVSGTWWLNGPLYQTMLDTAATIGGKFEDVVWGGGEADASQRVSESDQESGLRQLFADFNTDFGAQVFVQQVGDVLNNPRLESYYDNVREAEQAVATDTDYVHIGATMDGLELLDNGPHYVPLAYLSVADQMAQSISDWDATL